jgi:hypothetical protein
VSCLRGRSLIGRIALAENAQLPPLSAVSFFAPSSAKPHDLKRAVEDSLWLLFARSLFKARGNRGKEREHVANNEDCKEIFGRQQGV